MGEMSKYVMTMESVAPKKATETLGHKGGESRFLISPESVGSEGLAVLVSEYTPGGFTKGHPIHPDVEHAYYIMSGTMTLELNGEILMAPVGSFVYVPRGVQHDYRNETDENLRFIIISAGDLSNFARSKAAAAQAGPSSGNS